MLTESDIVPECIVRPGSLGGLIALYEGNFIKLLQLFGQHSRLIGDFTCRSSSDFDLHVSVDSWSRYTRLLRLTYLFEEPCGAVADPDLEVKIYLDARLAEVRSWAGFHRHDVLMRLSARYSRQIDRCWARNVVLSKWLDYLLEKGHTPGETGPR